jgi:hypothetical protein
VVTLDRSRFLDFVGQVPERKLTQVLDGICLVIGR